MLELCFTLETHFELYFFRSFLAVYSQTLSREAYMERNEEKKMFSRQTKRNHNEKLWINIVYEKEKSERTTIMHGLPASQKFAMNVEKREHRLDARQFYVSRNIFNFVDSFALRLFGRERRIINVKAVI